MRLDDDQRGGAIYQEPIGTFTFNGMATFMGNIAYEVSPRAAARVHQSIYSSICTPTMWRIVNVVEDVCVCSVWREAWK